MRWVLALLAGCSGNVKLDGSDSGAPTNPNTNCDGASTFVADISATSDLSGISVSITESDPTPPDVGDDHWTVEVTTATGQPATGLDVEIRPWMPLHGHGLIPVSYAGTEGEDGVYDIAPFRLTMPGLWEFPIDVGTADAPDPVVFRFCAQG